MQSFMQANAVRAAQLTIGKKGVDQAGARLHLGRARLPRSRSRATASCSRAARRCSSRRRCSRSTTRKKLTPGTKVYPLLGFTKPKDPRSDKITVQQLLDHMGG